MTVNLKTAKTLGLAVPPSLLARAGAVIERQTPRDRIPRDGDGFER